MNIQHKKSTPSSDSDSAGSVDKSAENKKIKIKTITNSNEQNDSTTKLSKAEFDRILSVLMSNLCI